MSSEGVRLAKERHGLDIHLGDACDVNLPIGHYDIVTLWHVLEHVAEPMTLMRRCAELLKPAGVLCVAVPNTDGMLHLTRGHGVRLPRLELQRSTEEVHLTHFTLATLKSLFVREGFDLIEEGLDDHSAEAGLKPRVKQHAYAFLHRLTGLAAGPCIFVAGRKRQPALLPVSDVNSG